MAKQAKQNLFGSESGSSAKGPVECLGMKFPNDEARRAYFTEKLREKLKDPAFRKIEGFPIGDDENILALSDPPYYTACPNPFLKDVVSCYGESFITKEDSYHREPFASDVAEGKYHPFYKLHPYPTKVPHQAIMRYLLHYTQPGDLILDGFCGTGSTGLAAQFCGDRAAVESLGYVVDSKGNITEPSGGIISRLGPRCAILTDICPGASFVAFNYTTPVDAEHFHEEATHVLDTVAQKTGWAFATLHKPSSQHLTQAQNALNKQGDKYRESVDALPWAEINYTVWSDVFLCPECGNELVFWNVAVNKDEGKVKEAFDCPQCSAELTKRSLDRVWMTRRDPILNSTIRQAKQSPVLISYTWGKKRHEKVPDSFDVALAAYLDTYRPVNYASPLRMPVGEESRRNDDIGLTHHHHYYFSRNLLALSELSAATALRSFGFCVTRVAGQVTKLYRFTYQSGVWGAGGGPLSGTLYVPSLVKELNILNQVRQAIEDQTAVRSFARPRCVFVGTQSSVNLVDIASDSIDYIFVDPPFGSNLMYSELLFLWEGWLRTFANNQTEAVVNREQKKGIREYEALMIRCFSEFHRVIKPGRWITVEFHNSANAIWTCIQEALQRAGFVIGDVRTLDKKKGTFKQTTGSGAVKQDLIISAYRPEARIESEFGLHQGTENAMWEFVRSHLHQLPVSVAKDGILEALAERQGYLLFDRMVAFHVQRGATVPMSAAEFYGGLRQRFPERDGMYFLPEQASLYDRKRLEAKEVEQYELFVSDEKTAIQWVRRMLAEHPMKYQDLQPIYMREAQRVWEKHEQPLELRTILEQNCVEDNDGTWRVPDPKKEADLEQLRHRALMKEFQQYLDTKGKLKIVRSEALRAGFKEAWQKKSKDGYMTIVQMAKRVPDAVIQEDQALLMYFDNASLMLGE